MTINNSEYNKVIFAAGNKYLIRKVEFQNNSWYAYGKKWIKSKQKFSSNALIHCIGPHYEEVENYDEE